ncbi:MAG TPA: hypothetical protein VJP79_08580 [Nitrososphaera sp.]|nr:hypothetical protein [Nitrososphaera sp.]
MEQHQRQTATDAALETYKAVRKKFYEAADETFGPGFLSMTEYYYMKTKGLSPFSTLFSEPRVVYDEWVRLFRGEEPVRLLVEKVAGPGYSVLLQSMQRNDGIKVWDFLDKMMSRNDDDNGGNNDNSLSLAA